MTRHVYTLQLDGEPTIVVRVLRMLLKRLARDFGIKCASVEVAKATVNE